MKAEKEETEWRIEKNKRGEKEKSWSDGRTIKW